MDFALTNGQEMIVFMARSFVENDICPFEDQVEHELGRSSMALNPFFGRPQNILMAYKGEQIERYLMPGVRGERIALRHPHHGGHHCRGPRAALL